MKELIHPSSLRILVGADVEPNPDSGASGTIVQMNAALRRQGHIIEEIWSEELGRRIGHGNLHYLLELPAAYRRAVRSRWKSSVFDVVELNQPHAYLAAAEHQRSRRPGVFVNRSHGHEVRSEEALEPWRRQLGEPAKTGWRRLVSRSLRKLLDRQWQLISRTADGFVVSCREDALFLKSRYAVPDERIGVITQGVPECFLQTKLAEYTPERASRLLYVGQFAFFKAPMMLARAVSMILRARPEARFTWICGRAHHAAARDLVDEDLRARVDVLDWMTQEQLVRVLDRHGVFLFPSFFEGFGKAPLEAMARGLCVVASDTGGMRDYIRPNESGILVPVGQPEVMAREAGRLLGDFDRCQKMSQTARRLAMHHTWDRCAHDSVDFYRQLLAQKKAAGER